MGYKWVGKEIGIIVSGGEMRMYILRMFYRDEECNKGIKGWMIDSDRGMEGEETC